MDSSGMHCRASDHCPPSSRVVIVPAEDQILVNKAPMTIVPLFSNPVIGVEVVGKARATEPYQSVDWNGWIGWMPLRRILGGLPVEEAVDS